VFTHAHVSMITYRVYRSRPICASLLSGRGRHMVSGCEAEVYRCACLHCTQGLGGRGDGYQCGHFKDLEQIGSVSSFFKSPQS